MAYTTVADGNAYHGSDVQQVINVLTGVTGEATLLTAYSHATNYTLKVKNLHATGNALQVQDPNGVAVLDVVAATTKIGPANSLLIDNATGKLNWGNGATPGSTNEVMFYKSTSANSILVDMVLDTTNAGGDQGAMRAIARSLSSGTSKLRSGEFQTSRAAGLGTTAAAGIEIGVHSGDGGANPSTFTIANDGAFIQSNSVGWLTTVAVFSITNAGSGYTNGTYALSITGGGGSGAAGTVTVAGGVLSSTNLTARGSGYTSQPSVSFSAGPGANGAITAYLGRRNDAAIRIGGADGWFHLLYAFDTDNSTILVDVDNSANATFKGKGTFGQNTAGSSILTLKQQTNTLSSGIILYNTDASASFTAWTEAGAVGATAGRGVVQVGTGKVIHGGNHDGQVALTIDARSTITANLLEARINNGTVLSAILPSGALRLVNTASSGAGAANTSEYTGVTNHLVARSTGVGTIKFADAVARDCVGFVDFWAGTNHYYIPLFNAN